MQKLDSIKFFKDEYEKFSNFYPVVIYYEGRNYPSIEHAYVAAKTKDEMFRKMISEMPEDSAGLAKVKGSRIRLRKDWILIKISVMRRFLMQKFTKEEFKELLLSTGDCFIEEGNYHHDNFWGNCYCKKCKDVEGKNNLGKLLMKIRTLIKEGD